MTSFKKSLGNHVASLRDHFLITWPFVSRYYLALRACVTAVSIDHYYGAYNKATTTATVEKTSPEKLIHAASNFIAFIPSRSIRLILAIFSGFEFYKTVSNFGKRK